ncbi:MAG: nitrilase-related carbon-nitrogen hydrolase [Acidobacteriota bacterium]
MRFTAALAQIAPKLGTFSSNLQLHLQYLDRGREAGVDLVIFPELSLTGYILQDLVPDVAINPRTSNALAPLLERCHDIDCIFGFVEVSDRFHYYNAAAYVSEGRIKHLHRKLYLPTYGMFDEMRFFSMGESLQTFSTRWGELGLLICEDLWHPSTIYLHALEGAQAVITISCSPGRGVRQEGPYKSCQGWENLLKTTAQFYTVYSLYVNRVGFEDGAHFPGGSMVVDPMGDVVAQAKYYEEDWVVAELHTEEIRRARLFTPTLRDERTDLTLRELNRIVRKRNAGFQPT